MKTTYFLPPEVPFANHGQTRASWIFVILVVLGSLILSVGMVSYSVLTQIVGVAVMVLGGLTGLGLRAAGYGQPRTVGKHDWYEV